MKGFSTSQSRHHESNHSYCSLPRSSWNIRTWFVPSLFHIQWPKYKRSFLKVFSFANFDSIELLELSKSFLKSQNYNNQLICSAKIFFLLKIRPLFMLKISFLICVTASTKSSSLFIEVEFNWVSTCPVRTCIKLDFCSSISSFGASNMSFSGFFELEFSQVWVLKG